jgi:uncharacterized protein
MHNEWAARHGRGEAPRRSLGCLLLPPNVKFHLSTTAGNVVTAFGRGWIRIGTTDYRENLVLTPETVASGFAPAGFEGLVEADFTPLLDARPDVVLLGTGGAIRFPHPRLTRALAAAQVGLEVMDTAAACRTYNILAAEGRRVTAALIL